MQECVECRPVVSTAAARKPLEQFELNEQPICAFSKSIYLPNFISVCQGVRQDNLPKKLGGKKTKIISMKKTAKTYWSLRAIRARP
jgi:hypothetical protein